MPSPQWLTLCWNGRPLGRITGITVYDWPWGCGSLVPTDWPPDLRTAVERLAQQADEDDELDDLPYIPDLYVNWSVVEPDGTVREIGVPRVDFATGDIEWR